MTAMRWVPGFRAAANGGGRPHGGVMTRLRTLAVALAAVAMLAAEPVSAAIVVSIDPPTSTRPLGALVTVDLMIAGLEPEPLSLSTFDIDIAFNGTILAFFDATFGTQLSDLTGAGSITGTVSSPGTVNLFELSLESVVDLNTLQLGGFMLARVRFDSLAIGSTLLTVTVNDLGDAAGGPLAAEVIGGEVEIVPAQVPEPAVLTLVLSSLALVSLASRRRVRHKAGGKPKTKVVDNYVSKA